MTAWSPGVPHDALPPPPPAEDLKVGRDRLFVNREFLDVLVARL